MNEEGDVKLRLYLAKLAWIIVAFGVGLCAFYVVRFLLNPFPIDYAEGDVLNLANLLHAHGNYFLNISQPPFIHGAYPPIFPGLIALFLFFFPAGFWTGRIISVVSAIAIAWILFRILRDEAVPKARAAMIALAFFAPSFVSGWVALCRVDLLAIAFSIGGLYVYRHYYKKKSWVRFLSVLLLLAAFYTKQSALLTPLAIAAYLAFRNRHDLAIFLSAYLALFLGTFALADHFTHGEFYLHIVRYSLVPFSYGQLPLVYVYFLLAMLPFLVFLWWRRKALRDHDLFVWYCVAGILSVFGLVKPGSNLNYLIEPYIAMLLLVGLASVKKAPGVRETQAEWLDLFFHAALIFELSILIVANFNQYAYAFTPAARSENILIEGLVTRSAGPILVDNIGYQAMAGLPVYYEPFQFGLLAQYGLWNPKEVLDECNAGRFGLIVDGSRLSLLPGLDECLKTHYTLVTTTPQYQIFRPLLSPQNV